MRTPEVLAALAYNQAGNNAEGILRPGLSMVDTNVAVCDPDTIVFPGTRVPLATPLENNSWYRHDYFVDRGIDPRRLQQYTGSERLARELGVPHHELTDVVVREAAERDVGIVFEQSSEHDVRPVLEQSARQVGTVSYPLDEATKDEPFANTKLIYLAEYVGDGEKKQLANWDEVYEAYEKEYGNEGPVKLLRALTPEEIETTYPQYVQAFVDAGVIEHTPIAEVFTETDYAAIMSDPAYMKFAYYDDQGIANLSCAGEAKLFNWFGRGVEDYFGDRLAINAPATFTRPGAKIGNTIRIFGVPPRAFAALGIDAGLVIETNEAAKGITRHCEIGTRRAKVSEITVGEPALRQTVHVLEVAPRSSIS